MKLKLFSILLLICFVSKAQLSENVSLLLPVSSQESTMVQQAVKKIKLQQPKWKLTGNHYLTGGLVFLAGASKGFNETLQFHWKAFRHTFPGANPEWFNPADSWRNKYKNGDPDAGAKFPLSTSVLVMFTDQYHLNNFINRAAWSATLVVKIGEGKKSFKHYVYDFLYYTACHQAGFALTYYPFKNYRGN